MKVGLRFSAISSVLPEPLPLPLEASQHYPVTSAHYLGHTGVVDNEDIDHFVVEAKKGQRITAEVEGIRLGITLFDTADAYGGGRSERAIGRWLARRGAKQVGGCQSVTHLACAAVAGGVLEQVVDEHAQPRLPAAHEDRLVR